MTVMRIKEGESLEGAYRKFRRSVEKSGKLAKVRSCEAFEKPTEERKRKKAAARKRHLKRLSRENPER